MKLFILFFSLVSFSQNLEEIKKLDTIYIYFNYGVYEKNGTNINIDLSKRDEFSKENVVYTFEIDDYNIIHLFFRTIKKPISQGSVFLLVGIKFTTQWDVIYWLSFGTMLGKNKDDFYLKSIHFLPQSLVMRYS